MKTLKQFTHSYPLSKTLRFELKPIGKTLDFIQRKGLINQDQELALSYQKVKKIIDQYHKYFIEFALDDVQLTKLEEYQKLYNAPAERKKENNFKKELEDVQNALRKEIVKGFKTGSAKKIFSDLNKKELITIHIANWLSDQDDKEEVKRFKEFTTYFTGFHENRQNMYSDKEQSTAIAFRLIHENLPRFLDNIKVYERFKNIPELHEKSKILYKAIEEYLNIESIDEAFELNYYNIVLTQKQIDVYNLIIGGKTIDDGRTKIQGLNEYINLYNQRQKDRQNRIPKLKPLYKQILSDKESISFLMDNFEDSQDVLAAIQQYYHANILSYAIDGTDETENILEKIKELLGNIKSYSLDKIYIRNDRSITDISQTIFKEYSIIKEALRHSYIASLGDTSKLTKKQESEINNYLKQPYYSIAEIEKALWLFREENDALTSLKEDENIVADYFKSHFKINVNDKEYDLVANVRDKYNCIKGILETDYPKDKRLNQEQNDIDNIKNFLDALMEIFHFVKPLMLPDNSILEKDSTFYNALEPYYEQLQHLIPLYNKVRNFATQKPYSIEKFKLNFENSTLLAGWDLNKETDNTSVLFRKKDLYYLGIMDKKHNRIFTKTPDVKTTNTYHKVIYKLLPGANKMLPKVFFSTKNIADYNPSDEIQDIRNHGRHTKNGTPQVGFEKQDFNINDCHKMIDFFKESIDKHPDWSRFEFNFSDTRSYRAIDEFYREVENQGYSITYQEIDDEYINQMIDEGKLYLFQIYNKDFSEYSTGKPNMHTMYWKALFDEENLANVVYKLNGQAEIFYRKKSIPHNRRTVHKSNEAIDNKNPNSEDKQSLFGYDIIKDRRFTMDKFQFHVPITLNFKSRGSDFINHDVLDFLRNNPDVNIIGLDRGERHLIYLTLINQDGEILEQKSLNTIFNKQYKIETSYHDLLAIKEKERESARENWGVIENIKELKEGYISQVVHQIAKMMVEHNAIVVMEDLNIGFKRGRFKVEKQVYQKLEKMLIDKLNYLVFKDRDDNEIGGLYNALQLTNKFKSFKEMGKQSGFLFYVPAWNTSKIDPTTGFVNLFNTRYESVKKAQIFFNQFDSIRFNSRENHFEFTFDYDSFTTRASETKTKWTICTYGDRIETYRNPNKNNKWDDKEINLTEQFEDLFNRYNILYGSGNCIKSQIEAIDSKVFLKNLIDLFRLTLQMRNSKSKSDVDYLISPIKNHHGYFFDSRYADATLPKDADANGAYNIARKGLMWLNQINEFEDSDWKKLRLDNTNKSWLQFAQKIKTIKPKVLE